MLGYVFNPVSFFYLLDDREQLAGVIPEVNNTYGQTHRYLLTQPAKTSPTPTYRTQKAFYVSPFIGDDYLYEWRFPNGSSPTAAAHQIEMDLIDRDGKPFFTATLSGSRIAWSDRALIRMLTRFPALPIQIIAKIHWQALRLRSLGLRYRQPPHARRKTPDLATGDRP